MKVLIGIAGIGMLVYAGWVVYEAFVMTWGSYPYGGRL